jgi:lipopolysaccharide/colanic/teichoic acid biosynthesis glycosyltransferase
MSLKQQIAKWLGVEGAPRPPRGILPEEEFRLVLERERALADRHDLRFCLLLFSAPPAARVAEELDTVARLLAKHLRKTDIAGWMAGERLGAILPFTPDTGARLVAERICGRLKAGAPQPRYEIIQYPSDEEPVLGDKATEPESAPATTTPAENMRINALLARPFPLWKRLLDILISSIAIVILSPLLVAVALYIKLVSPGPILFAQERVGFLGQMFKCWKFRTMDVHADIHVHEEHFRSLMKDDRPMTKLDVKKDPRVIPLGRLLRAAGIDELPQLLNVLRGEMSFIGPRPCIEYEFVRYQRWQKRRCDARPGLTGLWQVSGKNRTTFNEMMRMDISYARGKSFWKDLKIFFRTFPAVVHEVKDTFSKKRAG